MNAEKNFYKIHMKNFEYFKAQDSENGEFDVVFEIDGKSLYANKYILCSASTTFKSMLADRWTKPNEAIVIKEYTFEDFKEFLTFIYSGKCKLTDKNILSMIDISEFYNVTVFKEICEDHLTKMGLYLDNIFQMLEIGNKYSLSKLKEYINRFIKNNISMILKIDQFQSLEKSVVKFIVELNQETSKPEEIFEAVYKWAENLALEKLVGDQSLTLNGEIKEYLFDILPFIKFKKMNDWFLLNFVVKKSFLFSGDELSDILSARSKIFVKVIDGNGKIMKGELHCDDADKIAQVILSQKDTDATFAPVFVHSSCYWRTKQTIPSTPSKLIKSDKIEWYLVYNNGYLGIKQRRGLNDDDYLLAEMFAENEFQVSVNCKIETFCFA